MIDLDNQTELCFNIKKLEKIASSLSKREVELIITDDNIMKTLNLQHRGKAYTTDVLSFPLENTFIEISSVMPLGSIVIAASFVIEKANDFNHSIEDELSLLFIHGMLHLLGFDHEVDNGEMREKEKQIIEKFNLPKSLIVRNQG